MDAVAVNDAISLRHCGKGTVFKGTLEFFGFLFQELGVLGTNVKIQRLLLQKPLLACGADMIPFLQMLLHMVVHGVLATLNDATIGADKVAVVIFLIFESHGATGEDGLHELDFNFYIYLSMLC